MRRITERNRGIGAVLAFALVPLSGLATDTYLPSFPSMRQVFQVDDTAIQTTLTVFLISYGIGQFLAGTVLDSFGRYRATLWSLAVFVITCFLIAMSRNIVWVDVFRVLQGLCMSFVAVAKRTYFVDTYTGARQKSLTALNTIVWAVAPISAPFLGGFLEKHFSWTASFYFIGIYALIFLVMEIFVGGETLKEKSPFRVRPILKVYGELLGARDFSIGVVTLGLSFCMVIAFNMSVPFIVEDKFQLTPVVTGYCALCSGSAIFFGGLIGRKITIKNLYRKLLYSSLLQLAVIAVMLLLSNRLTTVFLLMVFVVVIHGIEGLTYNLFFTHCVTRFPKVSATASGITGGGSYIVVSATIAVLLGLLSVTNQEMLSVCYLILSLLIIGFLLIFRKSIWRANLKMMAKDRMDEAEALKSLPMHF